MIIGTTTNLVVSCSSDFDVSLVDSVIFYLQTDVKTIEKVYKDGSDVSFDNELKLFLVPLYQQDTMDLSKGEPCLCKFMAQINYADKSVGKSRVITFKLETSLGNTIIVDNKPSDNQRTVLDMNL
jgi:hypothetical protein